MLELSYQVGESEVDPQYRHVHHARILQILEWGRYQLLIKIGHPAESQIARGVFPVVTEVRVRYLREVLFGGITVTCDDWHFSDRAFTLVQRILNEKGKVAVAAEIDWLFMDGATRRAVEAPPEIVAALEAFLPRSKKPI